MTRATTELVSLITPKVEARFWSKVEKTDGCWLWRGHLNVRHGYGAFGLANKMVRAPRVAYTIARGPIPDGLIVCHSCDNRACVRPDHLWLGTYQDNILDCREKGRSNDAHGEVHPKSKLSDEQIRVIRRRFAARQTDVPALARETGMTRWGISCVLSGKSRKSAGGPLATKLAEWLTVIQRLCAGILLPHEPSQCWMWTGARGTAGYGKFWKDGKDALPHRVSYEAFIGAIPEGVSLKHLCGNKACVNPQHLGLS